jgi:hypothetical protein
MVNCCKYFKKGNDTVISFEKEKEETSRITSKALREKVGWHLKRKRKRLLNI